MASPTDPEPRRRTPLTRERVLQAAVAVADQVGLESLTMRRLGNHLGVEAMSLYKHVANKDEILDGIVDIVIGEIDLPSPRADWRTAMRQRAMSAREVLGRHPWAIGMMESRSMMGPAAMRYVDAVIGSLRAGGFSVQAGGHAFFLLDSYVYGFVVQEMSMSFDDSGDSGEMARPTPRALPDGQFPHLTEMAAEYVTRPDHDFTEEFDFGLSLILDGLETHLDG